MPAHGKQVNDLSDPFGVALSIRVMEVSAHKNIQPPKVLGHLASGLHVQTEVQLFDDPNRLGDQFPFDGEVPMGDFDFVPKMLAENGVNILLHKVAVKPGKPTLFGEKNGKFVFGLPGNPVSTFVMFELLVKPFLLKMSGLDYKPLISQKTLKETIKRKKAERDAWLPVRFTDDGKVLKVEYHGSAHINALCYADGLLKMPKGISQIEKGEIANVRCI